MPDFNYNKDWENIKASYKSWWKRENTDRPLFFAHVLEDPSILNNDKYETLEDQWLNIDKILEMKEHSFQKREFLAETYPAVSACLGPGSMALYLGSEPVFDSDTVWYSHCFDDINKAEIIFNKSSKLWKWTEEFTDRALARGQGKYLTEVPDFTENADILASLLGTENFLFSLHDFPDEIHRLQKKLLEAWFEAFNVLYGKLKDEEGGMSYGDFGVWAPGSVAKIQCDLSAMISSDMFGEFIRPYIKEQADKLDYSIYHLDGPSALQHTEHILSIESIKAVQWQPGSINADAIDPCWYGLQRSILDRGKNIVVYIKPYVPKLEERLEAFIGNVGKKGVLIVLEPYITDVRTAYNIINKSYHW